MDWTPVYTAIATGIITALGTMVATIKVFAPQWLAAQLEEKKAQMVAERSDREATIMQKAEEAAYERNRRATHEDRTHEMLYETLDFIKKRMEKDDEFRKKRMEKDDEFRERQLQQFSVMAEGITTVSNRYNNLYAAQTLTNQQLAVLTDSVRQLTRRGPEKDNGNSD